MEKIGSVVVLSLILLVASFSILSTIYLITIRKIKDLGILRFLGMKMDDIHYLIMYQALIIGINGCMSQILLEHCKTTSNFPSAKCE